MERGRPKNIESPEVLWQHFLAYKEYVRENPIEKTVRGNKNFIISTEKLRRPLTIEGFENYCFDNGIINDLSNYFANSNDAYTNFSTICRAIKKVIRQDQIEGGMVGIYNPSITQRLNALVEKVNTEVTGNTTIQFIEQPGNEPIK